MGWEYFDVVRFDLGPLLQGQTRITKPKSAYNLEVWDGKPTNRKSCALNLLLVLDWTLDPSFEVKCGSSYL